MHSKDLSLLRRPTAAPVDDNLLQEWPFVDFTVDQVLEFAREELSQSDISPQNLVILDGRTNEDLTCLAICQIHIPGEHHRYRIVRSDFESAIIPLITIETGCGGDDQLDTDYEGFDGVFRISVRDRSS